MVYLLEMCPIFEGPQTNNLKRFEKILKGCSSGSKNLLNFIRLTKKFYNYHHTSVPLKFRNPHLVPLVDKKSVIHLQLAYRENLLYA